MPIVYSKLLFHDIVLYSELGLVQETPSMADCFYLHVTLVLNAFKLATLLILPYGCFHILIEVEYLVPFEVWRSRCLDICLFTSIFAFLMECAYIIIFFSRIM